MTRRTAPLAWVWLAIGALYLFVPLIATFLSSIQPRRGEFSVIAYQSLVNAPEFGSSFLFSLRTALFVAITSTLLVVPTAYWVRLKLPRWRTIIEFLTLMPFVIPTVVLAFGLLRAYNRTPLTDSRDGLYIIVLGAYVVLSIAYMYRTVDTGLGAINVRVLTEAAQSLGAGWFTILVRVIFPNVFVSVLNGAFITLAIVLGEYTIAALYSQPAFGPYMYNSATRKVFEPPALAVISFLLTWGAITLVQWLGRRARQEQTAALR